MNISWLGHSCFKFEEKINGTNVTVITDPYNDDIGIKMSKQKADIVTVSHNHEDHNNVEKVSGLESELPLIFDRPGEYEAKQVFVTGISAYHDKKEGAERGKSIMFRFDIDGISILHLGDLGTSLSDKQMEKIGEVDILLVPVGGDVTIDAEEAAAVVRQIEPRIVIPMHYKVPGLKYDIDGVDKFLKEMGGKSESMPKLKIAKKDMPSEETKVIVLEMV